MGDVLRRWFPALAVMTRATAIESGQSEWPAIVFSVEDKPSVVDFPTYVGFDCFPGPDDDAVRVGAELARRLASEFACRSVCDGSGYGDDAGPYWSIVWSDGKSHLADDCATAFADGSGGLVRLIRELDLADTRLDESGRPMQPAQAPRPG